MLPEDITPEQLSELVRQPESERVEFKKRLSDPRIAAREIAALANSGGGWLIVGVQKGVGPVGEIDPQRTEETIIEAAQLVQPTPSVAVRVSNVAGHEVVAARVEGDRPPYIGPDGAITRRGRDGRRIAFAGEELQALLGLTDLPRAQPLDPRVVEALSRMNTQLEEASARLIAQQEEQAEERQLAARERTAAQQARGWRSQLVGWIGAGVVGAFLALAVSLIIGQ